MSPDNLQRGSWRLVWAYSKPSDWDHQEAFYLKSHPEELVCKNAGYLVWKDKKMVIFYSNNLALTPLEGVHGNECSHSVRALHGLSKLE
jgi:hypothetical protein